MKEEIRKEQSIPIVFQIFAPFLGILFLCIIFYSAFFNKLLGYASITFIPLCWWIVAFSIIDKRTNYLMLRSLLTGVLTTFFTTLIFFFIASAYVSEHVSHDEGLAFVAIFFISFALSLYSILFFLSYSFLIYYLKAKKFWTLIFTLTLGVVFIVITILLIFLVLNTYDLSKCESKYLYDDIQCIKSKCSMAPRDYNSCVNKIRDEVKGDGLSPINYCTAFLLDSNKDSEGDIKFRNCISDYLIKNQATLPECTNFEGVDKYGYQIKCYQEYKEHIDELPLISCDDVGEFYEGTGILFEESLGDFNTYCDKDYISYLERCEFLKKRYTGEFCEPSYYNYENSIESCKKDEDLYSKYC